MKKLILTASFSLMCIPVFAADVVDAAKQPPATKLEAFSARSGVVMIKSFTTIGSVSGMGNVTVDAKEFRDASNPKIRQYGITIEVKESGRLERENISYIDSDEIASLIKGIDYIAKIDKTVTDMSDFEATYRTKGDFSITTFSNRGKIEAAVSSGRIGKTTAFIGMDDLLKLKQLIIEATGKFTPVNASK